MSDKIANSYFSSINLGYLFEYDLGFRHWLITPSTLQYFTLLVQTTLCPIC